MHIPADALAVPWQALIGNETGDVALMLCPETPLPGVGADGELVVLPAPPSVEDTRFPVGRMVLRRRDIHGVELVLVLTADQGGLSDYIARRPSVVVVEGAAPPYVATVVVEGAQEKPTALPTDDFDWGFADGVTVLK